METYFGVSRPPWFLVTSERAFSIWSSDWLAERCTTNIGDTLVRFIRGARCRSAEEFAMEFAAALQLPPYVHPGLDSLDDALGSVGSDRWTPRHAARIFVLWDAASLASLDRDDRQTVLQILHEASEREAQPTENASGESQGSCPTHWVFQESRVALARVCLALDASGFEWRMAE